MIRKMNIKDIDEIQIIDKLCFDTEIYRSHSLLNSFAKEGASLVWEENGEIGGYIFNHILGNLAWFGTFGVHPDFRGKDIGKKLLTETINMFYKDYNIKNISLVTMPYSTYNVGFYSNLGFLPRELSVRLCKTVSKSTAAKPDSFSLELIDLQDADKFEMLRSTAASITSNIYKGLDFSQELFANKDAAMGSGFMLYEHNIPVGFGIIRNKTIFDVIDTELHLRLLALQDNVSDYKKALDFILAFMENYAASHDISKLCLDVNTANHEIFMHLLNARNFRIEKNSLNLSMGDDYLYTAAKGLLLFRTVC